MRPARHYTHEPAQHKTTAKSHHSRAPRHLGHHQSLSLSAHDHPRAIAQESFFMIYTNACYIANGSRSRLGDEVPPDWRPSDSGRLRTAGEQSSSSETTKERQYTSRADSPSKSSSNSAATLPSSTSSAWVAYHLPALAWTVLRPVLRQRSS